MSATSAAKSMESPRIGRGPFIFTDHRWPLSIHHSLSDVRPRTANSHIYLEGVAEAINISPFVTSEGASLECK